MSLTNPLPRGTRQVVPDYVAAGAGPYPVPFYFADPQDLFVGKLATNDGSTPIVPLTFGVDYTVAGAGNPMGGTVTLTPGIITGFIRVMGLRVPSRVTSVVNDGSIISSAVEKEFDAIELTLQELRRDVTASIALAQRALQAALIASFIPAGAVSMRQFRSALAAADGLYAIEAAVPAEIDDPLRLAWNAHIIRPTDALATFVQTTLGYSGAQMTTLFLNSSSYPV